MQRDISETEAELDMLQADFNDCNSERARWKARAEKAEAALAELENEIFHGADNWKARAEKAEEQVKIEARAADVLAKMKDEWKARAEKAEAERDELMRQIEQKDYPCSPLCEGYLRERETMRRAEKAEEENAALRHNYEKAEALLKAVRHELEDKAPALVERVDDILREQGR